MIGIYEIKNTEAGYLTDNSGQPIMLGEPGECKWVMLGSPEAQKYLMEHPKHKEPARQLNPVPLKELLAADKP
jgi:hypothetical protein